MTAALAELRHRLGEIADLRRVERMLIWDMSVLMPAAGGGARAAQLGSIERIAHDRFVDERIGELLDELEPYADGLPYDADDACLIRVTRSDWEKARRVPAALSSEIAKARAETFEVWVDARERSDFDSFRPALERMLELKQRYVECFAPYDDPYDALLDDYEPGMRTKEVRAVFDVLKPELTSLLAGRPFDEEEGFMRGPFPVDAQHALSLELLERFGAPAGEFRLDPTVHPFATNSGLRDIRITTRYAEDDLWSLFTAMHEFGHGIYQHGISPSLDRTPMETAPSKTDFSMALHESQSRLWENLVGRSLPFWRWFYSRLQETFPDVLGDVSLERFHRAVNRVRRSFIRVDADETTYGLHIILRFELEQELVAGRLAVKDLPEAWNARFHELFGFEVPNDSAGVLQDVHWGDGLFGYFPTYQLGNVLSVQIWARVAEAIPDLEEQIERGEFAELLGWLRQNLYVHGRKFTPAETIERVAGGPIDPQPYLRYLRGKLGAPSTA